MPNRGPLFIDKTTFMEILKQVPRKQGGEYTDTQVIYADLSRLVVALLARESPSKLNELYNELGWPGAFSGRALHEMAKNWMKTYHPDR